MTANDVIDSIGSGMVLCISDSAKFASLMPGFRKQSQANVPVDYSLALETLFEFRAHLHKLNPNRCGSRSGYREIGIDDCNGTVEVYCMMQ